MAAAEHPRSADSVWTTSFPRGLLRRLTSPFLSWAGQRLPPPPSLPPAAASSAPRRAIRGGSRPLHKAAAGAEIGPGPGPGHAPRAPPRRLAGGGARPAGGPRPGEGGPGRGTGELRARFGAERPRGQRCQGGEGRGPGPGLREKRCFSEVTALPPRRCGCGSGGFGGKRGAFWPRLLGER